MAIPQISLNNNVEIPQLGFGVYQVDPAETERVVSDALAAGYRHIDTAAAYFNEEAVGRAIASSGIPRNEIFVTTKLWISDAGDDGARRGFERSRTKLGLDYIDLYLIHQPYGDVYGSWRTLEKIYAEGGARAIGVSNFAPDRYLDLVLHNQIVPAVNQVETHPFLQRTEEQQFLATNMVKPRHRWCFGGSSNAASSSSPSPSAPNAWPKTSTFSTSNCPKQTWQPSPHSAVTPPCSLTTRPLKPLKCLSMR